MEKPSSCQNRIPWGCSEWSLAQEIHQPVERKHQYPMKLFQFLITDHWMRTMVRITLAHAFAKPSKVTYLSPEMLNTCLLAFSFTRTWTKALAKSWYSPLDCVILLPLNVNHQNLCMFLLQNLLQVEDWLTLTCPSWVICIPEFGTGIGRPALSRWKNHSSTGL